MVKDWIRAFRLRTLPLALACIGMGSFLAAAIDKFNFWVFFVFMPDYPISANPIESCQ